tara:strand:- start:9744 stop:13850 length:4107 start_codon:yes stop_codon:yes gene_type:complete
VTRYDDFDLNEFDTLDDDPFSHALSEDLPYRREKSPENVPIVTVFGAGVSGLTAAHELVQRGFLVQVVEKSPDLDDEYRADIGGLAKSQTARLKRTRRLHWHLYSTTEQNSYLKASPSLQEIDIDDDEFIYPGYDRHENQLTAPLSKIKEWKMWPEKYQDRLMDLTKSKLRVEISRLIREHNTPQRLQSSLKKSLERVIIPDLGIELNPKTQKPTRTKTQEPRKGTKRTQTYFKQPTPSELANLLKPIALEAEKLCFDDIMALKKVNESDIEVIRALRERPFQQVQKRIPISQKLTLPIGYIQGSRIGDFWSGYQRADILRNKEGKYNQLERLQALHASFCIDGEHEMKPECIPQDIASAYEALQCVLSKLSDIHGELQAQQGFFDFHHTNKSKILKVSEQVMKAVLKYEEDLEFEYGELKRTGGHKKRIENDRTQAREIYQLEIRSYCNLFSGSIRRNTTVAKLWSVVVKQWIISTIKKALADGDIEGNKIFTEFKKYNKTLIKDASNEKGSKTGPNSLKLKQVIERLTQNLDHQIKTIGLVSARDDDSLQSKLRTNYTEFKVVEHIVLGEHGFRFFPGFYRHIFDTMKRTPLLDENLKETGRTVFDQLVPPPPAQMGIAGESQFYKLDRDSQSPADIAKSLQWMSKKLGFSMRDLLRYQTQLMKFATSSPERRRLYEDFSWLEFADAKSEYSTPNPEEYLKKGSTKYSLSGETLLRELPQLLVAMSAEETDALTEAQTTLQLMLDDAVTSEGGRDKMLNGPSSTAWLQHWRRYLSRQGVRFFIGHLSHVRFDGDELIPMVNGAGPGGLPTPENPFNVYIEHGHNSDTQPTPDFYVLAAPYQQTTDHFWNINNSEAADSTDEINTIITHLKRVLKLSKKADLTWQLQQSFDEFDAEFAESTAMRKIEENGFDVERWEEFRLYLEDKLPTWNKELVLRLIDRIMLILDTKPDTHGLDKKGILELKQTDLGRLNGDIRKLLKFDMLAARRDSDGERRAGYADTLSVLRDPQGLPQPQFQFPLRDLTGIQYYFRELVRIGHGHFLLPKSPWGVSGIGQMYIWRRRPSRTHGFIGQLSVDIGDFYETYKGPDKFVGKTAWNSRPNELAEDAWTQITDAAGLHYRNNVSKPRYYQIDSGLIFEKSCKDGVVKFESCSINENMLMINLPGQWKNRPGLMMLDDGDRCIEYEVSNKRWVLAGNFMASNTRLSTMESANESGRLAANAIMRHLGETKSPKLYNGGGTFVGDYANIYDPERHEPTILDIFKNLDRELFNKRVPHFLDILDIPRAIEKIPDREEPNDPNSTRLYNLSTLVEQALISPNKEFGVLNDFAKQAGLGSADNLLAKLRKTSDFSNKMLEMMIEIFESGKTR